VLIIGLVRRSSSRSAQRAVTGEPAGYSYLTPGTTAGANPYAAVPVVAAEAAAYPTYPTAVYLIDPATTAYPTDLSGQAAAEPQVVPVAPVPLAASCSRWRRRRSPRCRRRLVL
jgi:hypothetical protein